MNENPDVMNRHTTRLLELLLKSEKVTEARLDAALKKVKLTIAKCGALRVLIQFGEPMPLGQMAEYMHCVRSNATQMVDRLIADGLAQRIFDPDDRRTVLAQVTEEGRRRYEAGMQEVHRVEQEILALFSPEEREQLISLLGRLDEG